MLKCPGARSFASLLQTRNCEKSILGDFGTIFSPHKLLSVHLNTAKVQRFHARAEKDLRSFNREAAAILNNESVAWEFTSKELPSPRLIFGEHKGEEACKVVRCHMSYMMFCLRQRRCAQNICPGMGRLLEWFDAEIDAGNIVKRAADMETLIRNWRCEFNKATPACDKIDLALAYYSASFSNSAPKCFSLANCGGWLRRKAADTAEGGIAPTWTSGALRELAGYNE